MLQVNASRTSLLILLMTVSSAHAQSTDTADLVLADVMSTALELSPDVERGRLAVADSAGARRTAASPFDLRFQTSLNGGRENLPLYGQGALMASDTITTGALLEKSFRSGMVVSSSLSVGRLAHSAIPIPARRANSSLTLVLPLAGGRGGGVAAGNERAAERLYDATRLEREHISTRVVRDAVVAYWQYVGSHERLRVHQEMEARAARLLEETEVLIRAGERPASDRDLTAGNVAAAQAARVAAEQHRLEARHVLGLTMGLDADAIPALGSPATPFPEPEDVRRSEDVVRIALRARRDLVAARARTTGTRLAWEGAAGDLRPRWDVVAEIGHIGISTKPVGGNFLSPLPGSATGLNASVQVRYAPAATNSGVQGAALRADAAHRTATVIADDLARRIRANSRIAVEALQNAARETAIAEEGLRLSVRAVETEREKFRLGLATVFDAILAEDTLTRALLRRIDARLRYAVALARLRFETGTLLEAAGGSDAANPDAALRFVLPEDSTP